MSEFTLTKLYKGKVEIKFFPESHIYYVNGERKTGVTTFIGIKDKSQPLIHWAIGLFKEYLYQNLENGIIEAHIEEGSKLHSVRKQEAATIGDIAHKWIEKYIKGEKPEMPDEDSVVIAVNAFLDWVKQHKVKFISSERPLYSQKHDYTGIFDIEAEVEGKLCLVDIKTSNDLRNDVRMQTAAYVMADQEESKKKYIGRWAVRLAKETEGEYLARMAKKGKEPKKYQAFEAMYLDESKHSLFDDFEAFLACVKLYRWNKLTDFYQRNI